MANDFFLDLAVYNLLYKIILMYDSKYEIVGGKIMHDHQPCNYCIYMNSCLNL